MTADPQVALLTAERFERMPQGDRRLELIQGMVNEVSPAGGEHGEVALAIGAYIHQYVRQHSLGKAYAAETGFILARDPDTVRAPDVAFVTAERAAQQEHPESFFDGPPDLAVEVVSPHDRDAEVEMKILDFLRAGTRLVWVVRPRSRTVTIYRSLSDIRVLTEDEALDGADVLPGFRLPVRQIFE